MLATLEYMVHNTRTWRKITSLLIPGLNDLDTELRDLSVWVRDHLGIEVPRHFSAFHPDWKMRDIPATPLATLSRARNIALAVGLHHVYTGNVHHVLGDASHCRACGMLLVQRDCYEFQHYALTSAGRCRCCCEPCAGHFADVAGHWGRPRMAIKLACKPIRS